MFGIIGVGEPFAVVCVAKKVMGRDQHDKWRDQQEHIPDQWGADLQLSDQTLDGEPGEAAGGQQEAFWSRQFGGGEAE